MKPVDGQRRSPPQVILPTSRSNTKWFGKERGKGHTQLHTKKLHMDSWPKNLDVCVFWHCRPPDCLIMTHTCTICTWPTYWSSADQCGRSEAKVNGRKWL